MYTVKPNAALLEGNNGRTIPLDVLWNNYVPPKVCFFVWEVWCGKVLTTKNLNKRGFQLASKCPLCSKAEEELNHLLFLCPSIRGLWEGLFPIPGIAWVCPYLIKDLFTGMEFSPP